MEELIKILKTFSELKFTEVNAEWNHELLLSINKKSMILDNDGWTDKLRIDICKFILKHSNKKDMDLIIFIKEYLYLNLYKKITWTSQSSYEYAFKRDCPAIILINRYIDNKQWRKLNNILNLI